MEHLIKLEGAVSGFCVQKGFIFCICNKTVYKIEPGSKTITSEKEIFEKDGLARLLVADDNRIFISDFCTLYVLNEEDYGIAGKWKIGEDLSSDICGMIDLTDAKRL